MGYDVFATGVVVQHNREPYRYPNYVGRNRPWGDEWKMNQFLDISLQLRGYNTGGTISGGITVGLIEGMAIAQLKRLLCQALQILTIRSHGKLYISYHKKNWIMSDEAGSEELHFTKDNVTSELRKLLRFLSNANLNRMGPLIDLCTALSDWDARNKHGRYLYNFDFKWS